MNKQIDEICAEYAVWAGNDITTANFKRLTSKLNQLISDITTEARIDELQNLTKAPQPKNALEWATFKQYIYDRISQLKAQPLNKRGANDGDFN